MLDIGIFGDKVNITNNNKIFKHHIVWLLNEIFLSQEILLPSLFPTGKALVVGWADQASSRFRIRQEIHFNICVPSDLPYHRTWLAPMFNQLTFQRNGGNCRRRNSEGTMSSEPRSRVFLSI